MPEVPQWFTSEVLRALPNAIPGGKPGQFYARCPVPRHADRRRSFAIAPGGTIPVVWCCHGGCTDEDAREALIGLGVAEEYLGPYGTPDYEASRQVRATAEERRQIERLRWEMLELKSTIRGLLSADVTLAMLKVRILAVIEGVDVPAGRKEYVPFAMKAGVSQPRAYAAWKADPLTAQERGISGDNVVLAEADEDSQAPQVSEPDGIIEARTSLSEREDLDSRNENYRNEKNQTDEAVAILRAAGLVPTKPAA